MIDISVLRAMAKAGASVDVILAAVEAMAEGARVQASKNAVRQQRWRDKRNGHVTSRNVMSQESLSSSFLLSSENPTSKKEVSKKERARKCFLPDSWAPIERHYIKGQHNGYSRREVDLKADDLRSWAKSKAIMRADWDATFDGFIRPKEVSNAKVKRTLIDEARELYDEAIEFERRAGIGGTSDNF